MYAILLPIHHYAGWAVLLAGLYAITKSVLGIMHKRDFTKQENIAHAAFLGTCHLQLLLGLILYFISPVVDQALANGMGAAMKDAKHKKALVFFVIAYVLIISRVPWDKLM